jgi:hypothetical protein
MIWIVLVAGIFNMVMSLITNTKNVHSAVIFKVVPFFIGSGCLIYSLKVLGVF